MALNRIQKEIFKELCSADQLNVDDYIQTHSEKYLGRKLNSLKDLSEKEADEWITRAYIESLG